MGGVSPTRRKALEASVGTLILLAFSWIPLPTVIDRWKDRWNIDFIEFFGSRRTVGRPVASPTKNSNGN
jgi:hypothetical protein